MSEFYRSVPHLKNASTYVPQSACTEDDDLLPETLRSPNLDDKDKKSGDTKKTAPRRRRRSGADHVKHRRTRNGCYTCRQRRVKCDEKHPICERCKKGDRECTYPEPRTIQKPSTGSRRDKSLPSAPQSRSPSSESEAPETTAGLETATHPRPGVHRNKSSSALSAPEEHLSKQQSPLSFEHLRASTDPLKLEDSRSPSTDASSAPPSAGLEFTRKRSSVSTDVSQDRKPRSHLAQDLQYYLDYWLNHLTCHHYFFKDDSNHFLHTLVFEQALAYEPLLYAIVGFGAFQMTVKRVDGRIQDFLGYYNESVSLLRKSLANNETHTDATMLTILQLATFEDYLGDWVSLLGHQQAAYRMLLELYTPHSIVETEMRRQIFEWYTRFDLHGSLMSGNETALGRGWFSAIETYYRQQSLNFPTDINIKFDVAIAKHRLMCTDMALRFAKLPRKAISFAEFQEESNRFAKQIDNWSDDLDPVFRDEQEHRVMDFGGKKKDPDDIVDPYLPGGLSTGPMFSFNFMLQDLLAITVMFKYKMALLLEQPPPLELHDLALELCRLFETIEYWAEAPSGAILKAHASLGIATLFLPKDERHIMWCRRKLAKVESLGHIYPSTFRQRMAAMWGIPEINHWWLPNDEAYPPVVRSVRSFMENRLPQAPSRSRSEDQRTIKGIFSQLTVHDNPRSSTSARPAVPQSPPSSQSPHSPRSPTQQVYTEMDSEDALLDQSRHRFWQRMGEQKLGQ